MNPSENTHHFPRTYWREIELPTFEQLNEDITVMLRLLVPELQALPLRIYLQRKG